MDFVAYAEQAVELLNADIDSETALRRHLDGRPWLQDHVTARDPAALAAFTVELASTVDASAAGDERQVVERLNRLAAAHPLRPRISGHDAGTWHLHVNDVGTSVAEILIGEALFGLILVVTEMGATRLGRCAAARCDRAFLDTTTNRSRRFCSARCASRTNVAEYRRRHQATAS